MARRREKKKKQGRVVVLFAIEIVALGVMAMFLYTAVSVEKSGKLNIPEGNIVINESVKEKAESTAMKGYRNIVLFGVDSTTGQLAKNTRSDGIIIVSVNMDTNEIRLVSVYRDTYLNLSNDSYNKCNAAYAKGGPEQAINMLNMNLDMNITDFVTFGFKGVADVIDALGGVTIDVDSVEMKHLNNYQATMAKDMKRNHVPLTNPGRQKLNGLQATAYCRIRYTAGDDFRRAERQREVLMEVLEQAKKASPATLTAIANDVFGSVYTSFDLADIVTLLSDVNKYRIVRNSGFPYETMRRTGTIGKAGSCVIPRDLAKNVIWLHEFLFDDENYEPSEEVKKYSAKIKSDTDKYLK
ncbi:MAG: LCP family protein [Lachnospiraceae bacterium]|jgi:LCP family protein required for cell wall assembly|nr:LCP family protein [Lachnospiraceae bacterium]